jgi:dihydrofolate reductase
LKHQIDADILVNGSGQLVRTLQEHDLIDEHRLMVYPVVLGKGKRLFNDTHAPLSFDLAGSRPAGETLILIYRPRRNAP